MRSVQGHKRTKSCYLKWLWLYGPAPNLLCLTPEMPVLSHAFFPDMLLVQNFFPSPCLFSAFNLSLFGMTTHTYSHRKKFLPSFLLCSSVLITRCIRVCIFNAKMPSGVVKSVIQLVILVGGKSAFLKGPLDSSSPT